MRRYKLMTVHDALMIGIVAAAFLAAGAIEPDVPQSVEDPGNVPAIIYEAEDLAAIDEPDEDESELIEAALLEQGYFREDVPLSFEEQDFLHTACDEFGVDYSLMLALIEHETNFRNIPGDDGKSLGYCQIQLKWWSGLMEEIGAEDLTVPYDNFRTACAIMARHIENYGSVERALTAYNTGKPGASNYASAIMARATEWEKGENYVD